MFVSVMAMECMFYLAGVLTTVSHAYTMLMLQLNKCKEINSVSLLSYQTIYILVP